MPTLNARWAQRERPIAASVVRQHFEQSWVADGAVLEALFRKLKSLHDCPAGQLVGKICTVIELGRQRPVAVWFTEEANAHDAQFLDRLLSRATAKTLLILDRGFYDVEWWSRLIAQQTQLLSLAYLWTGSLNLPICSFKNERTGRNNVSLYI